MNSEKIDESSFKILNDDEYLELSEFPLHLFEFWSGDIVEPKLYKLSDGRIDQVASKLVEQGNWPNRKFAEFKFKATIGQLEIKQESANTYREEIERVKTKNLEGQIFYPKILETIEKLEELMN